MNIDNPARQLLEILDALKEMPPNKSVRDALADVMGLQGKSDKDITGAMVDLVNLAKRTESMIRGLKNVDATLTLETLPKFYKTLFNTNIGSDINSIRSGFDDLASYGLRLCADQIDRFGEIPKLEEETLLGLLDEVGKLIGAVTKSDLGDELKSVVLLHLTRIQNSLLNYRIGGTEGLRQAAESGFTMFFSQAENINQDQDKPVVSKVWQFMLKILDVAHVVIKVNELTGGSIAGLLGAGS